MAVYLKADGIDGSCTTAGHEGWIELDGIHYGVHRSVSTQPGKVHNREQSGNPRFRDISITKEIDLSSPSLYQAVCNAKVIPTVIIDFCQTDKELYPIMSLKLTDVIISNFDDVYSKGTEIPHEAISFNFVEIEKSYTLRDRKNKELSPRRIGYNLDTATAI